MPGTQNNPAKKRGLDYTERMALVCNYFCQGKMPAQICQIMEQRHRVTMSRELPYKYLARAAQEGWIRFIAPAQHTLREHLKSQYTWLVDVEVAHTAIFNDVALHAARMLLKLFRERARVRPVNAEEVHVGFAGGGAMRLVAQRLAELLREPCDGLPDRIVFHAMVAGFNIHDPITAPNSFFNYFDDPAMQVEVKFVGLHAPPLVKAEDFQEACELEVVRDAFELRDEIDIVVTSGTSWEGACKHSMLREFMKSSGTLDALLEEGCVGDMLWRPFSREGTIMEEKGNRALTLVELEHLAEWIGQGKSVMLVLGPCRRCPATRGDLLRTILDMPTKYLSHLVVDSRSAAEVVRDRRRGDGRLQTVG